MPSKQYSLLSEFTFYAKALDRIVKSQIGYELRHLDEPARKRILELAVCGGNMNSGESNQTIQSADKSSFPTSKDVFDRARVISAGIDVFTKLALRGVYPDKFHLMRPIYISIFLSTGGFEVTAPISAYPEEEFNIEENILSRPRVERQNVNVRMKSDEITEEEEAYLKKAAREVDVIYPVNSEKPIVSTDPIISQSLSQSPVQVKRAAIYMPSLPKNYRPQIPQKSRSSAMAKSIGSTVPSSRLSRFYNFFKLGVGLGSGAAAEALRRTTGINLDGYQTPSSFQTHGPPQSSTTTFLTPMNAERIVKTLCRVRGAALKLGQMLSIQDEKTVPPYLLKILERVRQSADFMPTNQVEQQMRKEFGKNWRELFRKFEDIPFAAASIGQVHEAMTLAGEKVAVKIQYPGVAEGIDSDIDNLLSILNVARILPKGMFLENFASVARKELKAECDYEREARAMAMFKKLLADDPDYYVPGVFSQLSTKEVMTAEFVEGKPVDLCMDEPKEIRDWISTKYVELCLSEIFKWRFMQTDPNWSNFFFGLGPNGKPRLILLDFGATRSYSREFVDKYMKIIRAAYNGNREEILKWSREIGFLTGYESKVMEQAHCDSISIIAETLIGPGYYDYSKQDITTRVNKLVPIMLEHRLNPPPEEIYSLHRKLSGSFLLAFKLRACVPCGELFDKIAKEYEYIDVEDGKGGRRKNEQQITVD